MPTKPFSTLKKLVKNSFANPFPANSLLPVGLEVNRRCLNDIYVVENSYADIPRKHAQILSPGRSGTRWLSNMILECTNEFVCHSSSNSLATISSLYHGNKIQSGTAFGSYFYTRYEYFAFANSFDKYFIDLDCKNTPIGPVLDEYLPDIKFILMIRDPISFIKSGLARGYFTESINSQRWAHLEPMNKNHELLDSSFDRISKIAYMWRQYVVPSYNIYASNPSKSFLINQNSVFTSPIEISKLFDFLGIKVLRDPGDSTLFSQKANSSRNSYNMNTDEFNFLNSSYLKDYCLNALPASFTNKIMSPPKAS